MTIKSIYTDGSCNGNPGRGGWAAIICYQDGHIHEMGGGDPSTTNNRMEMQGAIAALEFFKKSGQIEPIILHTDSEYLIKGITQWIHGWKKKGWKTSSGKPVLNQDLWEKLDDLNSSTIKWQHVRGHSGDRYNERCDVIAKGYAFGNKVKLQEYQPKSHSPIETLQCSGNSDHKPSDLNMDINLNASSESIDSLPREVRVNQLRNLIETLQIADEISTKGYLITSSELADLMDVNASAVTSRGDNWVWRNWIVSRVRREGNQILWQLERVDLVSEEGAES
jgi:ribonuclease HI